MPAFVRALFIKSSTEVELSYCTKKNPACRILRLRRVALATLFYSAAVRSLAERFLCHRTKFPRTQKKGDHFVILSDNEVIPSFIILPILQIFLQSLNPIQSLPRKIQIMSAKMTISSCLLIDRTSQIQHLNNASWS